MIIGFSGRMGVGKSTAIEAIRGTGKSVELIKFAQTLYDLQEAAYTAISPVYQRPADFVKDRKLLQWLGTEWGRGLDQDLWVKLWTAKALASTADIVVCDDVRFDNEAEAIRSLRGTVLLIEGPSRGVDQGLLGHASEKGIQPSLVDYKLTNRGTPREFSETILKVYADICKKA